MVARSCDDRSSHGMSTIVLRGGVEVENPLELALEFLAAYSSYEAPDSSGPASFDERDLRSGEPGRCSHLGGRDRSDSRTPRRDRTRLAQHPPSCVVGGGGELDPVDPADTALRGVRGHPRSRLLEDDESAAQETAGADPDARQRRPGLPDAGRSREPSSGSFGEHATALVRSYKRDLDRNRSVLHGLQRELASRTYRPTEVRILDHLIWSVSAGR